MGWGLAVCPVDGEPVISTFEFPQKEFVCVVCGWQGGFLSPNANKTDDLTERHAELKARYDIERQARMDAAS